MLLIWKNKGLVVPVYVITSFIGVALITGILSRNIGGIFSNIDFYVISGNFFMIAAIWTYLTKDDYYTDRNGQKAIMDTPNEFFFIKMEIWSYVFIALSIMFFLELIF